MFKQVTHEEADRLIQKGDTLILDVRSRESFDKAHIPDAQHLSLPLLQEFCEVTDKTQPILVYCYHGISSQAVAQHLMDQGFIEVYSLMGGFEIWKSHHPASDANS